MIDSVSNQKINVFEEAQNDEFFNRALKTYLPSSKSKGLLFDQHFNRIARILDNTKPIDESIFALESFAEYYLYYAHYLFKNEHQDKVPKVFSQAARYGYFAIIAAHDFQSRFEKPITISQTQMVKYWSLIILSGWWSDMGEIGQRIYQQFDPDNENPVNFIQVGDEGISPQLWFLLKQYSQIIKKPLDASALQLSPVLYPYDKVLEVWDSSKNKTINHWVYLLSEAHLEQTDEGEEFSNITSQLFPYEIYAWLAIRKRKGLRNPKKYDHPLMDYCIAPDSSILPLQKPECIEAVALIEKLSESI